MGVIGGELGAQAGVETIVDGTAAVLNTVEEDVGCHSILGGSLSGLLGCEGLGGG